MNFVAQTIYCLFPLLALILLIWGIKRNAIYYVTSALWLSLIALVLHYQYSGGEILGSYFNYTHAAIYSANLLILFISLSHIITHLSSDYSIFRYVHVLAQSLMVIGCFLVILNLWVNAFFIENRMQGTPVMQVALIHKPDYCSSNYIFYKVNNNGSVSYLCPNYYGLIPYVGHLAENPDFIVNQLSLPNKKQLLLLQKKHT